MDDRENSVSIPGVIYITNTCDSFRLAERSNRPKLALESGYWAEVLEVRGPMQAAAIIISLIALCTAFYSFCWVAADAEAKSSRYRTRTSQARKLAKVYRMPSRPGIRIEVARGR